MSPATQKTTPTHANALGMVEFNSIAVGIEAADAMMKISQVDLVVAKTICPGKFIAMVRGDTAAVRASVEEGRRVGDIAQVADFVIPNVHPDVFPALTAATPQHKVNALGVVETFSVASCILAADRAAKTAKISLMEIRLGIGIGGKAFFTMTGDVAAVKSALEAGAAVAQDEGLLVRKVLIPQPKEEIFNSLS
ncbi:propanediol utilization protein [candidate division LCP-89 bacterium B3_LCP]|uniref:Propanediol utilization protein n=1 Tax=candidate division LCP-89 bacterium B3_LCP TaxID=2012998 RepID=A0A532UTZ4_UNCL8|nr:MAG: propanediol utilization protein [candidate division LCP-89 bacterium B3_LCP]